MSRMLRLTRTLVEKIPAAIPDPGPIAEIADLQTADAQARTLHDVLSTCPDPEQAWLFAFGSLMWKPDFGFCEQRRARVAGWHRAFCLGPDTRYRGNPERPGIMLSLDRGGFCDGIAFRLHETGLPECLASLIAREPPIPPAWVHAETEQGAITALAFVCDPVGFGYVGGLAPEETARRIAPAVGMLGSMADYLFNTASHLEEMGIHDPHVWQMQDLVAAELEKFP
ncbi:gamma-glutamylcyclotransferase [Roseibium sp.]|uniref:gamma-glutamylcyclotransferase n=1 Tax=Roseibium sp. TaxID=1936156 RepID=UPI003D0CA664